MKRLPMRKIREALRLRADGLSGRQVALSLSVGRATASDYLRRADVAGLSWPLPADLSDGDLERLLFPRTVYDIPGSYPQPDWTHMHAELRRKGVTLSLLWEEYRAVHPGIPRRWVVERTFAWLNRCRRLAKDCEKTIAGAEAWILIAHIRLVTRSLARYCYVE